MKAGTKGIPAAPEHVLGVLGSLSVTPHGYLGPVTAGKGDVGLKRRRLTSSATRTGE